MLHSQGTKSMRKNRATQSQVCGQREKMANSTVGTLTKWDTLVDTTVSIIEALNHNKIVRKNGKNCMRQKNRIKMGEKSNER